MTHTIDASQRSAAKVVGFCYLFAMAAAMFTEGYLRPMLVNADATVTAQNIMAHQALYRASLGIELLTFVSDATLIAALFVILSPINRHLAVYAAFLRMTAVAVAVMMTAHGFDALRLLGTADYLRAFDANQLAALARFSIATRATQYGIVFFLLGLGSTVFAYVWLKSGYVPRPLAMLGVIASMLLAVGSLALLLVPSSQPYVYPYDMVLMFFFEVGMGGWLLVKGLPK